MANPARELALSGHLRNNTLLSLESFLFPLCHQMNRDVVSE